MTQATDKVPLYKCLLVGAAAGLINGLFGTGGGMVVVPLLNGWLHVESRTTFASSLAVILPLSAVTLVAKLWQSGAPAPAAAPYLVGGIVGGIASGRLLTQLDPKWLHRVFGALILYGGVRAVMGW